MRRRGDWNRVVLFWRDYDKAMAAEVQIFYAIGEASGMKERVGKRVLVDCFDHENEALHCEACGAAFCTPGML